LAQLVQSGQASKTAVITVPQGAEVDVDGNKLGVTPVVFVLIKRETPRTITVKLTGYKTVEKTFTPDGKTIPVAITLEKQAQ
jgi:CRISPR/Cas system-associated exonuclease Cas4 (RecB family)